MMKKLCCIVLSLAAGLFVCAAGQSRTGRYRKSDLESESARAIRARMNEIRKERPTVALVLSGGGAKGAAHVGALEYLETLEIPVDLVVGTSIGGLVGGLVALGYTPEKMDSIMRNMDWDMALSDKVPREYISYAEKKYREKYVLSFPFYYSRKDYLAYLEEARRFSGALDRYEELHLGAADAELSATDFVKSNLVGSLPAGMAFGQNVGNVFSSLSVGYQDEMEFSDLPIPFVCVATDMVTGTAKIWQEGKFNTALRSTMSIPGLFAPVRTDGMVLVDGGMRDNYPTDLARQLGADIIIGIDISSAFYEYSDINNILDIVWTGIDMFGRDSYEENVFKTEVTIRPDIDGYGMMSFNRESIDVLIQRGWDAAVAQTENLLTVKKLIGDGYKPEYQAEPAVNIHERKVRIDRVEILGVEPRESRYLMSKIGKHLGPVVGKDDIENAVAIVFGTKAFDYVTYELLGKEEPFRLRINCKRGPIHHFGLGARFDTEELVSVLLNLGINVHSLQGSSLDLTGKVGTNPYASLHYYYNSEKGLTYNFSTKYRYVDRNQFSIGANRFNIVYHSLREELYLSNLKWSAFDVNLGLRDDYFKINSLLSDGVDGNYDLTRMHNHYVSAFLRGRADTFDDGYFPSRGFTAGIDYGWTVTGLASELQNFHALRLDWSGAFTFKDFLTIQPSLNCRVLFGDDIPLPFANLIGGNMAGRFLDQQIPFMGVGNAAATPNVIGIARADFRFRLSRNNYLSAVVNYGASALKLGDFVDRDPVTLYAGYGLEYAYDSIIGPVRLDVYWSDLTRQPGAFLGIGFNF